MKKLDAIWFAEYSRLTQTVGETYDLLDPSAEILVDRLTEFKASHYTHNPNLTADKPSIPTLEQAHHDATRLRNRMVTEETDDIVKSAYLPALDTLLLNIQLIIAGTTGDMPAYRSASEQLYDQPDQTVFKAACAWIRDDALQHPSVTLSCSQDYATMYSGSYLAHMPIITYSSHPKRRLPR